MKQIFHIIYICAAIWLPILPAYILYKSLPSEAIVRGPFKGLKIKLTGAFAGYFLLVLLVFSFIYFVLTPPKTMYEVWRVTGAVEAKRINQDTNEEIDEVIGTTIGVIPPTYDVASGGKFNITVMAKPGHIEGEKVFPTLQFNRAGYMGILFNLNCEDIVVNDQKKEILIKNHITLKRLKEKEEKPQWKR